MTELEELKEEVRKLREEIAALRAERVTHVYHHQVGQPTYVPPSPWRTPTTGDLPWMWGPNTCSAQHDQGASLLSRARQ